MNMNNNKNELYSPAYKCRMCGKIIVVDGWSLDDERDAAFAIGIPREDFSRERVAAVFGNRRPVFFPDFQKSGLNKETVHICEDGSLGMVELVGMKRFMKTQEQKS